MLWDQELLQRRDHLRQEFSSLSKGQQHSWPLKTSQTLLNASFCYRRMESPPDVARGESVSQEATKLLLSVSREFGIKPWWHWKIGFLIDSSYNSGSMIETSQLWQVIKKRKRKGNQIMTSNAKLNISNKPLKMLIYCMVWYLNRLSIFHLFLCYTRFNKFFKSV